jgi:succinate dehydrogenase/fumarate reductase flavoprotein subunit
MVASWAAEVVAVTDVQRFDVAVIGGGAAGLSAAVMPGRARRSVVVVAAAEGASAAIAINGELVAEDVRRAVATVERV